MSRELRTDDGPSARLSCAPADLARLQQWVRAATAPRRLILRSRIVLLLLDGRSQMRAARELGVSRETVGRWERRFAIGGADALTRDRPGRGRRPGRNAAHVARVLDALGRAPVGTWTTRGLAEHLGISAATVQRIWSEHAGAGARRVTAGHVLDRRGDPIVTDSGHTRAAEAMAPAPGAG